MYGIQAQPEIPLQAPKPHLVVIPGAMKVLVAIVTSLDDGEGVVVAVLAVDLQEVTRDL